MRKRLAFVVNVLAAFLALVAIATLPAWAEKGLLFLASLILVQIVFATSFNVVFGLTGLISFGHAAFFAAGAYACGALLQHRSGFVLALGVGAAAGGVAAVLVAFIALRRATGIHLAILTLALAELLHIVIARSSFLGREDGLSGIKRPVIGIGIGAVDLARGDVIYYFILVCATVSVALLWVVWHNRLGRMLAAVRQDPERARFLGVNVHASRLLAFTISGCGAGLAGALYAPLAQLITPDVAHWTYSALPILFCLLGGAAFFWGPIVGTILFMGLEHSTRNLVGLSEMITGATLLLIVLAVPGGVLGTIRHTVAARTPRRAAPLGAQ